MGNAVFILLITLLNAAFGSTSYSHSNTNSAYDVVLKSIINARCTRYVADTNEESCKKTVSSMLKILDYDVILLNSSGPSFEEKNWDPRSFLFIAFKQRLIELLSSPQTKIYLEKLNLHLNNYLLGKEDSLTIFEFTKNFYYNEYRASEVIATLFQDTTFRKLHLAYLEETNPKINLQFDSNKELLSRVIDMIGLVFDSSEDNYKRLFYPENLHKNLNRNIYQFYVPFFLSKALVKTGVSKEDAASATLMLTLSYEFVTSSHGYNFLFTDPSSIQSIHKIKDIFAGYCGSTLGTKGISSIRPYEGIKEAFHRSTTEGVRLILKR